MLKHLKWDSEHFGIRIGELKVHPSDSSPYSELTGEDFDLVYIYSDSMNYLATTVLDNLSYTEERAYYFRETPDASGSTWDRGIFIKRLLATELNNSDLSVLRALAEESGKYSRFKLDPKIPDASFTSLYHTWIENSLKGEFDDCVYASFEKDEITGIVSYKEADKALKIGLFAVSPAHQRKGIGQALLKKIEELAWDKGLKSILIPTQTANTKACNFYEKSTYSIQKREYLSHLWLKYQSPLTNPI